MTADIEIEAEDQQKFGPLLEYLAYFRTIQDELATAHHGKFVVIHRNQVLGIYDDVISAHQDAEAKVPGERILIQECIRLDEEEPVVFRSRVR